MADAIQIQDDQESARAEAGQSPGSEDRPRTLDDLARVVLSDPKTWFATPNPQLGGRCPGDLVGTVEESKIYNILAAVEQGLF